MVGAAACGSDDPRAEMAPWLRFMRRSCFRQVADALPQAVWQELCGRLGDVAMGRDVQRRGPPSLRSHGAAQT